MNVQGDIDLKLKKSFLSLVAVGVILFGGISSALAQPAPPLVRSGTGSVTVAPNGTFDVEFCGTPLDFGTVSASSYMDGVRAIAMQMCYTDTLPQRGSFLTYLSAEDFTNDDGDVLSASAFKPNEIHMPWSGQWGTGVGTIKGHTGSSNVPPYTGSGLASYPWVGGNLSTMQLVGSGDAGKGTAGNMHVDVFGPTIILFTGTMSQIDMQVVVPSGQPAGVYTGDFTITIVSTSTP